MKKFFDYIQLPNFDIAADAAATFKVHFVWKKFWLQIPLCNAHFFSRVFMPHSVVLSQELLTRHKSTVAEFLSKNYDWVGYPFKVQSMYKVAFQF